MKLDFKRIMSSVLAFVMLFSSLVMVNVVSVSAADGDRVFDLGSKTVRNEFILSSSDGKVTANGNKSGKKELYTFSEDDIKDFVVHLGNDRNSKADADTVSDDYDYDNQGYLLIQGPNDYITFYAKNDNASLTIYVSKESSNDRQITVTGEGEGKATPKGDTPQTGLIPSNNSISKFEYTLDKADTYKIQNPSNGARIYSVIVNDKAAGEEPTPKATWNVETDSNLTGKVTLEPLTNSTSAVLRYTSADNLYSVIPSRRIIKTQSNSGQYVTDNEDGSHTLNLKGTNWEYYLTQNINVPVGNIVITDGVNRALHLKCKTHNTVYTIKLQDGQAYAMIEEGENGGYTIPEQAEETIPLHNGELIASMAGGQLEKAGEAAADEVTFNIDSEASEIKATYKPFTVEKVNGTVEKTEFNKYKVSSVVRGERLFGGTVLDPEGKHFFVAAEKDVETDGVYTLTDPVALGTDIDMKAVVLRAPGSVAAGGGTVDDEQGIGFILADKTPEESETNVTYTLKVYCTSVNQNSSGAQKATETSIAIREIDPVTYTAIRSGYTKSDSITVQDDDHVLAPEKDYKEFANLQPGKAYAIFNPAGEDGEPQGNIRVYAMELTKIENTVTPSGDWYASNQNDILGPHYYKAATSKLEQNGEFYEAIFEEGKVKSINGQEYVSVEETAPIIPKISGTLKLYVMVDNTSDKSAEIKENGTKIKDVTLSKNRGVQGILPIEFKVEASKEYTIKRSGTGAVCLYKAVLTPDGPVVATISGKVTQSGKYEDVAGYEKSDSNLFINKDTDKGGNSSVTVNEAVVEPIKDAKVTIKGVAGTPTADVNQTVNVNAEDGTYSLQASESVQLPDGAYTVSAADKSGRKIGSDVTVNISAGKADKNANFTVEKNVTITFKTNIKDFKNALIVKDSSKEVFKLDDITYHLNSKDGDIARLESVTHKVQMPVGGTYTINNSNTNYEITSSENGATSDTITFVADKNKTVNIYFKSKTAKDVTGAVKAAETAGVTAEKYATRGTYTFTKGAGAADVDASSGSAAQAGVKYTLNGSEDAAHNGDIYGYGYGAGTTNKEKRPDDLTLEDDKGYIVFRTNETYVAKITVEAQIFTLVNADGGNTINGASKVVIDSRYKDIGLILEPGTYVLYTSATGEGYVKSIELNTASAFNVIDAKDVTDESLTGTSKMIIGAFDNLDSLDKYTKFAIIVSSSKEALDYAALSNEQTIASETKDNNAVSTDEYTPTVYDLNVLYDTVYNTSAPAIRDETTQLYKHIYGIDGSVAKEVDKSESQYFYAAIVENIQGPLYAVGASKTSDAPGAKWMVQTDIFTVNAGN